jgi:hypothetical protein
MAYGPKGVRYLFFKVPAGEKTRAAAVTTAAATKKYLAIRINDSASPLA